MGDQQLSGGCCLRSGSSVDCVLLVIARAKAIGGGGCPRLFGIAKAGSGAADLLHLFLCDYNSCLPGRYGTPSGYIRGLGQFKRIGVVAGSRPWMLVRVAPQHSAVDDMS